jgi:hypothetical protein
VAQVLTLDVVHSVTKGCRMQYIKGTKSMLDNLYAGQLSSTVSSSAALTARLLLQRGPLPSLTIAL